MVLRALVAQLLWCYECLQVVSWVCFISQSNCPTQLCCQGQEVQAETDGQAHNNKR